MKGSVWYLGHGGLYTNLFKKKRWGRKKKRRGTAERHCFQVLPSVEAPKETRRKSLWLLKSVGNAVAAECKGIWALSTGVTISEKWTIASSGKKLKTRPLWSKLQLSLIS